MRLLVFVAFLLVVLAAVFVVKAIQQKRINKWRADFYTLNDSGETVVYISKGHEKIEYASIAPAESYVKSGKSELDRQIDVEEAMDTALTWVNRRNR